MADIICPRCGEPWDAYGIRNDMAAPLGWPSPEDPALAETEVRKAWGSTAPPEIVDLTVTLARAEAEYVSACGLADDHPEVRRLDEAMKAARDALGLAVYNTGLAKGCPACWDDPSTIPTDPAEQDENLRAAIFDGVWDGDPAEFFA